MKNHNDDSAQSVRSTVLGLPAAPTPTAHATLNALFADPAFVGTLRETARRTVKAWDLHELLANAWQRGLSSPSSPEELEACKLWVQALVRRQMDNYRWHRGLPLAPPRITAQPVDPKPLPMREQLLIEDGFKDLVAVSVEDDEA